MRLFLRGPRVRSRSLRRRVRLTVNPAAAGDTPGLAIMDRTGESKTVVCALDGCKNFAKKTLLPEAVHTSPPVTARSNWGRLPRQHRDSRKPWSLGLYGMVRPGSWLDGREMPTAEAKRAVRERRLSCGGPRVRIPVAPPVDLSRQVKFRGRRRRRSPLTTRIRCCVEAGGGPARRSAAGLFLPWSWKMETPPNFGGVSTFGRLRSTCRFRPPFAPSLAVAHSRPQFRS